MLIFATKPFACSLVDGYCCFLLFCQYKKVESDTFGEKDDGGSNAVPNSDTLECLKREMRKLHTKVSTNCKLLNFSLFLLGNRYASNKRGLVGGKKERNFHFM